MARSPEGGAKFPSTTLGPDQDRKATEGGENDAGGNTRRKFLSGALALSGTLALSGIARRFADGRNKTPTKIETPPPAPEKPSTGFPECTPQPKSYQIPEIFRGKTFADLYSHYTGIAGKVGKDASEVSLDFDYQLLELWRKKVQFVMKDRGITDEKKLEKDVFYQTGAALTREHINNKNKEACTLQEYKKEVASAIESVRDNLDWDQLANIKNLNAEEERVVKKFVNSINANDLMAYCLTELMPGEDSGRFNVAVLDFILRNAGRKFVESLPAIYDDKTSFGPYQFTSFALYDDGKTKEGASIINRAIKNEEVKIPGSVAKLRGNDHHRAAILFIIDNFIGLVKKARKASPKNATDKKWKRSPFYALQSLTAEDKRQLIMFAATAHHMPAYAKTAGVRWLDALARYKPGKKSKKPLFIGSLGKHLAKYAKKTDANLSALENI